MAALRVGRRPGRASISAASLGLCAALAGHASASDAAQSAAGSEAAAPGAESPADPGAAPARGLPAGASRHRRRGAHGPVLFGADDVTDDQQLQIVIARGDVEITEDDQTLLADAVTYNKRTDTVTATGHVSLIRNTGDVVFGDFVQLTDRMRDGFVRDVRLLLSDRSRLAGNTGLRTDGDRLEIRRGVYSPCDLCTEDPTKPPLWQLRAEKVIDNENLKIIEYEQVRLEVMGVPIFYSPYLAHPDPSVKRQSGVMAPSFGSSSTLGFHTTLPYYFVTGPDSDFTFSPIVTSAAGVVIAGSYRQVFTDGKFDFSFSGTNTSSASVGNTPQSGNNQLRGHILTNGIFDLDDEYRAQFSIQRSTDQTYLRVYQFNQTNSFLPSHAGIEDFAGRDYGSADLWSFEPLTQGFSSRTQPWALPSADYTWYGLPTEWGGKFTTNLDAIDIFREGGNSSRRLSLGTEFDLPFKTGDGELLNLIAAIRGDGYSVYDAAEAGGRSFSGTTGRVFPQLGLEWRDPWVRYGASTNLLIEPRVAVYAAPVGSNPLKIPDNDSLAIDFNETDLFSRNRLSGYDQVDDGQRVDYALHASVVGDAVPEADLLFGQSWRLQRQTIFPAGTGLDQRASDYVGRLAVTPSSLFNVVYRFRYSERAFTPERQEVDSNFTLDPVHLSLSYVYLAPNPRDEQIDIQQIRAGLTYNIDRYWTVMASAIHGLASSTSNLSNSVGVQYADECFLLEATLSQTGTHDRDLQAGTSIFFQVVFKNLGQVGLPALRPFPSSAG